MDSLKIHNSLTREKQLFSPIVPGEVGMYVCGMTVYDYCHLGHARVMVVFDLVQRWLRQLGYRVTYVRNITDIDDKIIRRAVENGEAISSLTERFIQAMNEDADALGVQRPDHEPRATRFVPQMLGMIAKLEAKGLAYRAAGGDVNYAVRSFPGYGRLSGKSLDDLRAGERVEIGHDKRDPLDFVLWKAAKPSEPDEARWTSPWGHGRPGWHIECSAMAAELLGPHFDIHGGGQDLQFPHHENEIAQSEGAHGCAFVNVWMHNGFVRLDNEKMSKSLGNFFTIREVLKKVDAEVVRFFILRTHYRSPLNYSDAHLDDAKQSLTRLYTALNQVPFEPDTAAPAITALAETDRDAADFCEALNDDFNTPLAFRTMFHVARLVNLGDNAQHHARVLRAMGQTLGLLERRPQDFLRLSSDAPALDDEEIAVRIQARTDAKKAKDFAEADRIRRELADVGILLEDRPGGVTEWRRA